MKAWVFDGIGGLDRYRIADMPMPDPGDGEVQIAIDGAGMNPVDFKIRRGEIPPWLPKEFPAVALREYSGVISRVGPQVAGWAVGDQVWGLTDGTAAQYAIGAAAAMSLRPLSLDPAVAGLVPLAAMTAWQGLFDHGQLKSGDTVLIHAAGGGVGTFAVQLAKWAGARVIGTASAHREADLRDLGLDELIDYHRGPFEHEVADVDVVLHTISPNQLDASLKVLKPGGRLISITGDPANLHAEGGGKFAMRFGMTPNTQELAKLADLVDEGALRPVVCRLAPLEQATEAMAELETGHAFGKIGVRVR